MERRPDGEYVRYSDVERVRRELEERAAEANRLVACSPYPAERSRLILTARLWLAAAQLLAEKGLWVSGESASRVQIGFDNPTADATWGDSGDPAPDQATPDSGEGQ